MRSILVEVVGDHVCQVVGQVAVAVEFCRAFRVRSRTTASSRKAASVSGFTIENADGSVEASGRLFRRRHYTTDGAEHNSEH